MKYKYFKNKKIIITGHTGFKGSWLLAWLTSLGADVLGISKEIPRYNSNFKTLKKLKFKNKIINIKDYKKLKKTIIQFKPDFIFHLAAQAIVYKSLNDPRDTWETNLIGTMNLLQSIRFLKKKCSAVIITSDKCYENLEISKGYKETDRLGGSDPYSASKASAEILIKSYFKSFLKKNKNVRIASARAGNVIGGGDWSSNRIIPDCVRAWKNKKILKIRNPNSTRPWQHVLEPIRGYMDLAIKLNNSNKINGESFNFGPRQNIKKKRVIDVVKEISKFWSGFNWKIKKTKTSIETNLLSLNCEKAKKKLNWSLSLTSEEAIKLTSQWYKDFYDRKKNNLTLDQINYYEKKINKRKN